MQLCSVPGRWVGLKRGDAGSYTAYELTELIRIISLLRMEKRRAHSHEAPARGPKLSSTVQISRQSSRSRMFYFSRSYISDGQILQFAITKQVKMKKYIELRFVWSCRAAMQFISTIQFVWKKDAIFGNIFTAFSLKGIYFNCCQINFYKFLT